MSVATDVIAHHLRIFGVTAPLLDKIEDRLSAGSVHLAIRPTHTEGNKLLDAASSGDTVLVVLPNSDFLRRLQVSEVQISDLSETYMFLGEGALVGVSLRSLHPTYGYLHPQGTPLLQSRRGVAIWIRIPVGNGYLVLLGSDVAADLIRYRQGDPQQAATRSTQTLWGISGERPNYLFDSQIPPGCEHERQADWWPLALAITVSICLDEPLLPLLPNGSKGAIVITGDDDQAFLEKYQEQLHILAGLPITYFLHPLTRHTKSSLKTMIRKYPVELGLHPDALDQPALYSELFRKQAAWYQHLTGARASLVRNHGFLNDGYWGHLAVWLEQGIRVSSNLPGLNGKILNSSLLPARVVADGQLSSHWSILTAIGDGIRFALNMSGSESAECIRSLADRISSSRIPGVIVFNLHPQNIAETQDMHKVLHELVQEGFMPMKLSECIDWFSAREINQKKGSTTKRVSRLSTRIAKLVGF